MEQFEQSELAETTVDLKEYFYLFWSWAWLIILAGILAGVMAFLVSINMQPIYQTSTTSTRECPACLHQQRGYHRHAQHTDDDQYLLADVAGYARSAGSDRPAQIEYHAG